MITKTKGVRYEIYWKNGEGENSDYQLISNRVRTIGGVIRQIRATCNHSEGSGFKVFKIIGGVKEEINYHKF